MKRIAYLHNHSVYSEKDGQAKCGAYAKKIEEFKSQGIDVVGLAMTEHGNMFSMVKHYNANSKVTNAIMGCEVYHCEDREIDNINRYHMVLLAKDDEGLSNLYNIVSDAGLNKLKGKTKDFPRTHDKVMAQYGKGIIALSACIGGIIPQLILNGQYEEAKRKALYYNSIFEEFYLEIQPHTIPEQLVVNSDILKIHQETGIPLVITTDTHYIDKKDKQYHNILKKMARHSPFTVDAHMMSYDEIYEYCINYNIPLSAIENTVKIAEKCTADPRPKDKKGLLPTFPCPIGYTEDSYLRELVMTQLYEFIVNKKFTNVLERIERTNYELDVICRTGFSGYFLILWDWFKWCRENNILMGKGRGSGAGSLVCYLLSITTIDPISNGFIFERFLNLERLEMPDVDSDVSKRDRARAINYLLEKYGAEYVSQIITFSEYGLKNTISAVFSNLYEEVPFEEVKSLTKSIPDMINGSTTTYDLLMDAYNNPDKYEDLGDKTISKINKCVEKLEETFEKYPEVYLAITNLKGCIVGTGLHAGGVVIAGKPLASNVPVMKGSDTAVLPIVQVEMDDMSFFKLLKIDVLGLNTLTQISDAMHLIGLDYDWYDSEDFSDPAVYEMLKRGETTDIFQMGSFTASKMLRDMAVDDFEILGVVNAGNRPGPLAKNKVTGKSMVDIFIERKASGIVPSIDPRIDWILAPTLGCIWYQEQCQLLGQVMAGYSLGMADLRIRKVLAKKKLKEIPVVRNEFIYGKKSLLDNEGNVIGVSDEDCGLCVGAIRNGFSEEVAIKIFDAIEEFAKYSFNKAHSGSYAAMAYKTAWLSLYYPAEWAVACLTSHEGDKEKITATLSLCKKRGIKILPPDILKSDLGFTLEILEDGSKAIRYGLLAILDVGSSSIEYIKKVRENYQINSFEQFYNTVHDSNVVSQLSEKVNKNGKKLCPVDKSAETALIKAGAFDSFEDNRYKLLNYYLINIKKDKDFEPLNEEDYCRKYKLAYEKELMGSYISEHPLDPFPYSSIESAADGEEIETTGIITKTIIKQTKAKKDFATVVMETKDGKEVKVMVFGAKYTKYKDRLKKKEIIVVTGEVNKQYSNINASKIKKIIKKSEMLRIAEEEDGIEDMRNIPAMESKPVFNIPIRSNPMDDLMAGIM